MPRPSEPTRKRILDAAYGLFYQKDFRRVGVDEICQAAGITKKTLYYHFSSKDTLLEAVLRVQSELALKRIRKHQDRYSGSADSMVGVLFSELARWSTKPGRTGAGFTRLAMELADLPGHPARRAASRHKAEIEIWWIELLESAGISRPEERARENHALRI
jgi:AcrR family transcriptional regulator